MKKVCVIFPHQLFRSHPCVKDGIPVFLVEEFLFFCQYRFHRQKIILHRASMKFYEDWLIRKGLTVHYIDAQSTGSDCRQLVAQLAATEKVEEICIAEPADDWLMQRMSTACLENGIKLHVDSSPNF